MLLPVFVILILTICTTTSSDSGCIKIEILGCCYDYGVNGVYIDKITPYIDCTEREIYTHQTSGLYLYHIKGYWVVYSTYCSGNGVDNGYIRVYDTAEYPEYIHNTWQEMNFTTDQWYNTKNITLKCYEEYEPNDSGENQSVNTAEAWGIAVGCLFAFLCIGALIRFALKRSKRQRQNRPEPGSLHAASNNSVYNSSSMNTDISHQMDINTVICNGQHTRSNNQRPDLLHHDPSDGTDQFEPPIYETVSGMDTTGNSTSYSTNDPPPPSYEEVMQAVTGNQNQDTTGQK